MFATPAAAESSLQQVVDFFIPFSWAMSAPLLSETSPKTIETFRNNISLR
jgi:hypothetical protein